MKTVLVTGCSGYLGGHVARKLLSDGWQVIALTRQGSVLPDDVAARVLHSVYDGTFSSIQTTFKRAPIDVVVHMAAAVVALHDASQLDTIIDANIRLPTQLLEAMRQEKRTRPCRRFVNTGSFWQYRNSDVYVPVNLYAASKQAFEDLARTYVDNDGMHVCTLVLFDTYGSDDPRRKIVRLLVDAVDAAHSLLLSPGDQILDLTDVEDVAAAFTHTCTRMMQVSEGGYERFRISGDRMSLRVLTEVVARAAGKPINVELGAKPYRDREIMVPILDAIAALPGWTPQRSIALAIKEMLNQASVA